MNPPGINIDVRLPPELADRLDKLAAKLDGGLVQLIESAERAGMVRGFVFGIVFMLVVFWIWGQRK